MTAGEFGAKVLEIVDELGTANTRFPGAIGRLVSEYRAGQASKPPKGQPQPAPEASRPEPRRRRKAGA